MYEKNSSKFQEIFGDNYGELLSVTSKVGISGHTQWNNLSATQKSQYKQENKEIRSVRVQKISTTKNGNIYKDLWELFWVDKFIEAGKVEEFKDAQREVAIEVYWKGALKICKDYNIFTDRGIAIVFDRTINQGAGGCRSLVKKIFKKYEDRTVEEEIKLLEAIRDNWEKTNFVYARVNKILSTSEFSNQLYILQSNEN